MKNLWLKIGLSIGGIVTLIVLGKGANKLYKAAREQATKEFFGSMAYSEHFGSIDVLDKALQTRIEGITQAAEKATADAVMARWAKRFGG